MQGTRREVDRAPGGTLPGIAPPLVAPPLPLVAPPDRVVEALDAASRTAREAPVGPEAAPGSDAARGPDSLCLPVLVGDLAAQWAVDQELAREGLDREAVEAEELRRRAGAAAEVAGAVLDEVLADRSPAVRWGPREGDGAAAQAAFVGLYEAGLVELTETVAPCCPRCRAVLGPEDVQVSPGPVERFVIRTALEDGPDALDADLAAPELLGAVAGVAVPPGYEVGGKGVSGRYASVPGAGRRVPVVEDEGVPRPTLLTPGHDPVHFRLARQRGLEAPVLAEETARFAAREAALERLGAEGLLVGQETGQGPVAACAHCGTAAEARLGARWVLDGEVLARAVEDHLGSGPAPGGWCLGRDLWIGTPLPVGWCAECTKPTVAVASTGSCGICLGELRPDGGVLDPVFCAAVWAAEALRPEGGVLLGGDRPWLVAALALALRLDPGPVLVVAGG